MDEYYNEFKELARDLFGTHEQKSQVDNDMIEVLFSQVELIADSELKNAGSAIEKDFISCEDREELERFRRDFFGVQNSEYIAERNMFYESGYATEEQKLLELFQDMRMDSQNRSNNR